MARIRGAGGGGGGGGGCFLGHTLVCTPDGQRAIETLQPGDEVVSFDDQGELHHAKILKVHVHEGERVMRYRLWGGAVLDATPNHWVLNQFNAFVEIGTLGSDDCLVDENGHLRPIVERTDHGRGTVYNLTVEGHHTFIAGGIRVHNAGLGLGVIAGAGGGGGGGGGGKGGGGGSSQRTPTEEGDSLDSRQYAQLIDLISEGEIYGLKNGHQSIFVNNTPLQNADGSYNFQNVSVFTRNGTQNQSYIPIAADSESEKTVGVTVRQATPVVRTITSTNVNAARVTITLPQLQRFTDQGDIVGASVQLQIAVQYNGGGYTTVINDTIAGRTGDQYQKDYVINFAGAFPVDIKVTRVTADSSSSKLIDAFSFSSYAEIIYAKLRYPNSALVGLRVDAEQFSNIPSRSYLVRGIKVRIPNNATVDSTTGRLIYAGVWNGTFAAAQWCTDPAWILWDLLTSTRYGFGDHIDATQLDKWAFYSASVYANQLVPNGFGGQEPRFSCNVNIQTQDDAYKLINDMCSVFRAMPYWSTGALTVTQDAPADASYLFTLANVSEEGFSYSSGSLKTRPTVCVVSYLDLDLRDIAKESVENRDAITKYGVVTREISAFACTSRGQARRLGEWLLYSEWNESEVVNFTASIDAGVLVRPGQIIEISDPVRAGSRRGGRITSATTTAITVDNATGLTLGAAPQLSVILPNGTVETKTVSSIAGNVFNVSSAFSAAPNANSVWIYETSDLQTSTWRVLTVEERDQCQYGITALAHNASKYNYIERNVPLQQRDTTNLNAIPDPPTNLTAIEALYENNGRVLAKIIYSWRGAIGVNSYQVRWRRIDGNWTVETINRLDYEIFDTFEGVYEIQVFSLNGASRPSIQPASITFTAYGKTAPPSDVTGANLVVIDNASGILNWDLAPDLDVKVGGKVLIRHSPRIDTPLWSESVDIVHSASGNQTQKQVPILKGSYLLRFEDDGGRMSLNTTYVVTELPTPQPRLAVFTYAEDATKPPFQGNLRDMFYSSILGGLVLSSGLPIDSMATNGNWDSLTTIDDPAGVLSGPVVPQGEYDFASNYDMGGVFDVNLQRRFLTAAFLQGDAWDAKLTNIDLWDSIDGNVLGNVNASLYVRSTSDNPNGTPIWSDWREFANAIVRGRAFQFKTIATSGDTAQNIIIKELGLTMELQQRTEQSGILTGTAGAYSVSFVNPFYQAASVGITGFNMVSGDYFAVSNVTRTGFQVTFRNSAGAAVARQFTYTAIGYGREII